MLYLRECFRHFDFSSHCLELSFPKVFWLIPHFTQVSAQLALYQIGFFLTNQYKISHHLFSLTLIFYLTFVRLHIHFLICYCLSNPLEFKLHENRKLLYLPPPLPTPPHPHLQCLEQHLALGSTQWLFGERVSEWMNEWMRLHLIFLGFCYDICLSISSTFFKILSTSITKRCFE